LVVGVVLRNHQLAVAAWDLVGGALMTDWLSVVERGLKAVRYGFFNASDQLALALDGLCRAPEEPYVDGTEALDPDWEAKNTYADGGSYRRATPAQFRAAYGRIPSYAKDSVVSPPADAAPVPKPGDSSPSTDCDIPRRPSGGAQTMEAALQAIFALMSDDMMAVFKCLEETDLPGAGRAMRAVADQLDPPK
jgi:hypothetical protein